MVQFTRAWKRAPENLDLPDNEVHIWGVVLDGQPFDGDILSDDERERADRFHFQQDRDHFVAARCGLRTILGWYLKGDPEKLDFCYSDRGKPGLAGAWAQSGVRFNLTHSGGVALYAITRGREVGVDVERLDRTLGQRDRIAERFFSPSEYRAYCEVPEDQKLQAFLNCWTRKEAFIKALGEGLYYPLDRFEVSLAPGEEARLIGIEGDPEVAKKWAVRDLDPCPGYVGAVAVEGQGLKMMRWQMSQRNAAG